MGAQHGELVVQLGAWERVLAYYPTMTPMMLRGTNDDRGLRWALRLLGPAFEAGLRSLARHRPAAYRARSAAFFAAAGIDARMERYLFVTDLFQNIVGLAGRLGLGDSLGRRLADRIPPACTTLAVWGDASADGRLRHARNFDFPGMGLWELHPTVVFCEPDDGLRYGFVTTRGADVPGITAFNEAGLVVTAHTRLHRDVSFSATGVVDAAHDVIRRASTLAEATAVAKEHRWASAYGLAVSSGAERGALSLETAASHVAVVRPKEGADYLAVTNHYVDPDMASGEVTPSPGWRYSTVGRARSAEREALKGGLSARDLEALLGSHEDPEEPGRWRAVGGVPAQGMSVQSVVIEPEDQVIRVSVGDCPTGKGPYVAVPWSWSGAHQETLLPAAGAHRRHAAAGGATEDAYACYLEACRLENAATVDCDEVLTWLERAVARAPEEGTYRLMTGALLLKRLRVQAARHHFEAGVDAEPLGFVRAQLLLWACRAAQVAGDPGAAERHRFRLLDSAHPTAAPYRIAVRREIGRPWTRGACRKLTVNLQLPEVG